MVFIAGRGVGIADYEVELFEWRAGSPGDIGEGAARGHGVVKVFFLAGRLGYETEDAVNVFFGVFLGPGGFAVFIADIDDLGMIGIFLGAEDAAVFGYDIAAPDYEQGVRYRAGGYYGFLHPVPVLVYGIGVEAVYVCIKIVEEYNIWPGCFVACTTG